MWSPRLHNKTTQQGRAAQNNPPTEEALRRLLLVAGFLALAVGLLWIGQGTGLVAWPKQSFMINQIQWAGYGAALSAVGLILIWQSQS
jgi:uncharacterized membrane protein